ncbi:MAG TPA: hypothetical protein VN040_12325 [Pseudosphingobacterium sp.]|nr:hypothetical protein [Pseudosphingobacterium sp.]
MNEVIVKYKSEKALKALQDLGKYLGFSVSAPTPEKKTQKKYKINGVTVIKGDSNIDINELKDIFTGPDIDAATLRKTLWQRKR